MTKRPKDRDQAPPRSARRFALVALLLFLLTVSLYWGTRGYEFVWDDQPLNLAGNQELMRNHHGFFWTRPYRGLYVPVAYSTWIWLKQVAEPADGSAVLQPHVFRTANILLHGVNTVLVLALLYSLVGSLWAALAGAVLFAIHPLQVEAVVWITEYRGLLASCFSLGSLVCYRRAAT